ncbi:MAG: DUF2306 domain-containing protein [Pseudomonadota bacterium]
MNSMELYKPFLYVHITGGTTALICGLIAILTTKGMKVHRMAGKIYFYAMIIVAACAIVLSSIKPNPFLFSIAIFALYMTYTGYRSVKNKKFIAQWYDWLLLILNMLTSLWMISNFELVLAVFGTINLVMCIRDFQVYRKGESYIQQHKLHWLLNHISRMIGAYIATVTAFLVVNIQMNPSWVPWLTPTILGVPLIAYFSSRYSKKPPKAV